jgi:hypothetical protein
MMTEQHDFDAALLDEADLTTAQRSRPGDDGDGDGDGGARGGTFPAARVGRRGLVTGLALGGVAVVAGGAGSLATSTVAGAGGVRREQFTIDIACLGDTTRSSVREWGDEQPSATFAEGAFAVEGWIYPAFTIPGDGFVPVELGSIGRWFCRGWFVNSRQRGEPHVSTSVDLVFGTITEDQVVPPDLIALQGPEGTGRKSLFILRPVTGGTGKYLGASGQIKQWYIGDNTTDSPCWRYEIDIRVWD